MTTYWGFRDSIKIYKSLKLVIFGHNLGTVATIIYPFINDKSILTNNHVYLIISPI